MQEEILLKKYRTGTTITFFDTMITEENFSKSTTPAALYFNSTGKPIKMIVTSNIQKNTVLPTSNQLEIWNVSGNDNIQRLQDVPLGGRVITGRTFSQTTEQTTSKGPVAEKRFKKMMNDLFSGQSENYVFVHSTLLDDFEVTFKLERTYDVLNTLNTYNKVYNEFPERNSKTGVVFGKLEAVQKIKDENGDFVKIPLRGVPVGIFMAGKKISSVSDVDNNGNRIKLNFKDIESQFPEPSFYANETMYNFDFNNYLEDKYDYISNPNDSVISMPEEFKHTVLTNENGEFIIHDVPVGPQVLMFDVDLLQQGLTTDEVALNFFPYEGENISNINEVPHFFFRQIPIDVLPTWGTAIQTGYTEVNIKANIDLRKWATYFFPPVCALMSNTRNSFFVDPTDNRAFWKDESDVGNCMLDRSTHYSNGQGYPGNGVFFKIGDPYLSRFSPAPLTIEIRDMTKINVSNGYVYENDNSNKSIQVVKINDILERQTGQINSLTWVNEFSQVSNRVEFRKFGYNAIKLPANLYDPLGYKTDEKGKPKTGMHQKGVWLNAYQFKMYHMNPTLSYRTTGFYLSGWQENKSRDAYHLNSNYPNRTSPNFSGINEDLSATEINRGAQVKHFPFEKPWTINYPSKYSIPELPKEQLPPTEATTASGETRRVMESPNYADGDIIGEGENMPSIGAVETSGFAHAKLSDFSYINIPNGWYSTSFSYSITNSKLYCYEKGYWKDFGTYANGYIQGNNKFYFIDENGVDSQKPLTPSHVKNGEEWQRVEAGYGYYLHAKGLPKIGKKYGFNYAGEYSTSLAVNGEINAWPGFRADTDFYYAGWDKNYSVAFDNGHIFALRLDYIDNVVEKNRKNQGPFTIYRIVNPGVIADSTKVSSLIENITPTKYNLKLDLGRTRLQNEKTTSERMKFQIYGTNARAWRYWNDSDNGDVNVAYVRIKNFGIISAVVKVGNESKTIAAQDYYDFKASVTGKWDNSSISFESNDNLIKDSSGNWVYNRFNYNISFRDIKIGNRHYGDNDVYCKGNYNTYTSNLYKEGESYNGKTIYLVSGIDSIKTRSACGSSSSFTKHDILIDGMLFLNAKNTTPKPISFADKTIEETYKTHSSCSPLGSNTCWCDAYGGFYYKS